MNSKDYKDKILAAVPIESYIGRYVALKQHGRYYKGLCPFHSEKSPSFTVTPDKGLYHCFGCGKGGDLFSFVMDYEGLTFPEALEYLGQYAGIERPAPFREDTREDALLAINEQVKNIYAAHLKNPDALSVAEYLKERGIASSTIERFSLGAAPDLWSFLESRLPDHKKEMLELGLTREKSGRVYDFFRGRVIFPIQDLSGRVIAFGGRSLPSSSNTAKYVNSPESILFHKGRVLYGLYASMPAIRKSREALIVEGYLDVLGLHEAGIENTVAPLGTALTFEHLTLLQKYASSVVAVMDGDTAGRAAAVRFSEISRKVKNITGSVLLLPPHKDPFDLSKSLSSEKILELLSYKISTERYLLRNHLYPNWYEDYAVQWGDDPILFAKESSDFFREIRSYEKKLSMEERKLMVEKLYEFVALLEDKAHREITLDEGSSFLGLVNPTSVKEEWSRRTSGSSSMQTQTRVHTKTNVEKESLSRHTPLKTRRQVAKDDIVIKTEWQILSLLIHYPELVGRYITQIRDLEFTGENCELLLRNLESRYLSGDLWLSGDAASGNLPQEVLEDMARIVVPFKEWFGKESLDNEESAGVSFDAAVAFSETLLSHRQNILEKKVSLMEESYRVADAVSKSDILKELNYLSVEIQKIKALRRGGDESFSRHKGD